MSSKNSNTGTRSSSRIAGKSNSTASAPNVANPSTSNAAPANNNNPPNSLLLENNTMQNQTINPTVNTSTQSTNRTLIQSGIPPLMSLPTGLQTTSSPESVSFIMRPEYSSITADQVRREFERMNQHDSQFPTASNQQDPILPISNPNINLEAPINHSNGPSLREFISASVRLAQSEAMKTLEDRLAVMIPQVVRHSIDSIRNLSLDHNQMTIKSKGPMPQIQILITDSNNNLTNTTIHINSILKILIKILLWVSNPLHLYNFRNGV